MNSQLEFAMEWLEQAADGSDDDIIAEIDAQTLLKYIHQLQKDVETRTEKAKIQGRYACDLMDEVKRQQIIAFDIKTAIHQIRKIMLQHNYSGIAGKVVAQYEKLFNAALEE